MIKSFKMITWQRKNVQQEVPRSTGKHTMSDFPRQNFPRFPGKCGGEHKVCLI